MAGVGAGDWELVGIPYTSMKRPGGIADAIGVLRESRLGERLTALGVADGGDLPTSGPDGIRGPSGLLNEKPLSKLVVQTRARVSLVHSRGRRPLLVGGDCPVLLGPLAAMRDSGERPGLVMLDGHEDAWPPDRSDTGEASDSEVAIALGLVSPLPEPLAGLTPILDAEAIAMLGPRDLAELEEAGVATMRDRVAFFVDDREARSGPAAELIGAALAAIDADGFWLHVDLDALSEESLPAVDYPQPGGWSWARLDELAAAAARDPACRGVSVVIYNPERDPDRSGAHEVVGFVARLAAAC
jgi:arginase